MKKELYLENGEFALEQQRIYGVTTKAEFPQQMRELKEFLKSEQ